MLESNQGPSTVALTTILTSAMAYGTITFFVLAALSPFIVAEFDISRAQLGLLTTIVYGLGAALSPLGGKLSDRFGGRRLLFLLFGSAGAGLLLLAGARLYSIVIVAVALTGVATAITNPGTNQLLAEYVPLGRRGKITGVKQSGIQLGGLLIGTTLPVIATQLGWRIAAGTVALSAVALGLLTLRLIPVRRIAAVPVEVPTIAPLSTHPRDRVILWVAAFGFAMSFSVSSVGVYIPLYVVEELQGSAVLGGVALSVLSTVGVLTKFITGAKMVEGAHPARTMVFSSLLALAGVALLGAAAVAGLSVLWLGVLAVGIGTSVWQIVAMVAILAEIPLERAGHASGVLQLAFYGGFACSPVLVGALVDRTGTFMIAWYVIGTSLSIAMFIAVGWWIRHQRDG